MEITVASASTRPAAKSWSCTSASAAEDRPAKDSMVGPASVVVAPHDGDRPRPDHAVLRGARQRDGELTAAWFIGKEGEREIQTSCPTDSIPSGGVRRAEIRAPHTAVDYCPPTRSPSTVHTEGHARATARWRLRRRESGGEVDTWENSPVMHATWTTEGREARSAVRGIATAASAPQVHRSGVQLRAGPHGVRLRDVRLSQSPAPRWPPSRVSPLPVVI